MADFNKYVIPLFEALIDAGEIKETPRFLGMAFSIDKDGTIATCSHLFADLDDTKVVIAIQMSDSQFFLVENIDCHQKYDFAIASVRRQVEIVLPFVPQEDFLAGLDVMAYGVNSNGKIGQQLDMCPRLMKGHIVRIGENPPVDHAKSICEVSFPSLAGFSGTPILSNGPQQYVAGMLYGNYESSIELFKVTDIDESGNSYNEQIHRIFEFGLAHTPEDMLQFLKDLGYES
ncbi:hypothetical protein VCR14J2_390316 [Vibrio coralliirubri]|uniref:S1 family peptidase n=1 Tax=Vibrio coralliirubri TaxID=1516159 RepID=UPI00063413BC|nr:serine protease [Vibrio coralliirubri]CDU05625.1 hypothetical protein VCR14J2_390316 [Vibrio coralliirubri]